MAEFDLLKSALDAGMAFTEMTRQRAESIVRDLVHTGEASREQTAKQVEELLERSRKNTEVLLALVRKEIDDRLANLGVALPGRAGKKTAAKKATATKAPAKKAPAKKT